MSRMDIPDELGAVQHRQVAEAAGQHQVSRGLTSASMPTVVGSCVIHGDAMGGVEVAREAPEHVPAE